MAKKKKDKNKKSEKKGKAKKTAGPKKKKTKKTSKKSKKKLSKATSTVARSDDGNIQITFTIPYDEIETARKKAAKDLAENIDVPGFRKGKAPIDKVVENIDDNKLLEATLSKILPELLGEAIQEHDIEPAIYPKFELVKAKQGEDWQVRATTCEIPDFELGDYKKTIKGMARASAIWTPDKGKDEDKKEPNKAEKEQEIIKALLESVDVNIPKVLIDEEVNSRVSRLIDQVDKLGLDLESYLSSVGKTAQSVREEYEKQAKEAIALDLILNKIAQEENIKIEEKEIEAAVKAGKAGDQPQDFDTPERRRFIKSILMRRKALDSLTSLV